MSLVEVNQAFIALLLLLVQFWLAVSQNDHQHCKCKSHQVLLLAIMSSYWSQSPLIGLLIGYHGL